jgi:hypothetical protein
MPTLKAETVRRLLVFFVVTFIAYFLGNTLYARNLGLSWSNEGLLFKSLRMGLFLAPVYAYSSRGQSLLWWGTALGPVLFISFYLYNCF